MVKQSLDNDAMIPVAIAWATDQLQRILRFGQPLDDRQVEIAQTAGVIHPDRVRLLMTTAYPLPDDKPLREAASRLGMLGPQTIGLTLRYGVMLRAGHATDRVLAHEFRHVQQFEKAGSLGAFLADYLSQIITVGYQNSPLEIDARAAESAAIAIQN